MDVVGFTKPIRDYVDALVHPSVQHDALAAARHRTFIAPRLIGSLIALAAFPVYVSLRGAPDTLEVFVLAWLVAPILVAHFLARTGRYEMAHALSALALTGLGTTVAAFTGGIASFAAVWLVIAPLEAALSGLRRMIAFASVLTFGAVGLLVLLGARGLLPTSESSPALATLVVAMAALYASGIALGAQSLMRTGSRLRKTDADRYRMLSGIMTDAITRHDRNGAIVFASPAAEPLFGAAARDLIGNGLFNRVHVADRPAYLTTLADAAEFGHERSAEFRVRRETVETPRGIQFIWVEMRCQPVDGAASGTGKNDREIIAVMRDITECKDQAQEIANLREGVTQATAANSAFLSILGLEQNQTIQRLSSHPEIKVKKSA